MGNVPQPVETAFDEGYYIKMTGFSYNAFLQSCQEINADYERFDAVMKTYTSMRDFYRTLHREPFVHYIGFAVPTPECIQHIHAVYQRHVKEFPDGRLVDVGAGTGVFCWLLHRAGIPAEKLIALDLPRPTHPSGTKYWPITEDEEYSPGKEDVLLVCWGNCCWEVVERYIAADGKRVMILGEAEGGCTIPWNALEKEEGWAITEKHPVTSGAHSIYPDYLTVNERS